MIIKLMDNILLNHNFPRKTKIFNQNINKTQQCLIISIYLVSKYKLSTAKTQQCLVISIYLVCKYKLSNAKEGMFEG